MSLIDLHIHTTESDGSFTPTQAVELASELGLAAVAITDHDTAAGYAEAKAAGDRLGVEVAPGIEISTKYGGAVHILGYYINMDSPALHQVLDWVVEDRDERNEHLAKLMAEDGLPVSYPEMQRRFGEVIGRPHFGELLVELGLAADVKDAFARYLDKGQKYFLPRKILPIERAVGIILDAGGLPVLAHPLQYRFDDGKLRELTEYCVSLGLRGMECMYSGYTKEQSGYLCAMAEEYGLFKTGGSDFHGSIKPHIAMGSGTGDMQVPYEYLEIMKAAHRGN